MILKKAQKETLLVWIAEGLQSDEINEKAGVFDPPFSVSRQQVDYYRKTRHAKIQELKESYENKALNDGLANKAVRIRKLKRLAKKMEDDLFEKNLMWLDNAKTVATNHYDFEEFNKAEIDAYRAVLDDIAKEVGGRVVKSELSGKDGKPIVLEIEYVNDWRNTGD